MEPGGDRSSAAADAPTPRTAVIITAHDGLLEGLVEQAGYEIAGVAAVAVNGERLIAFHQPDVIIVENELRGEQGWEALPHLKAASRRSQVLLVVADDWRPSDLGSVGAFAVITRSDLEQLVTELDDLDRWIAARTAEAETFVERRSGRDRRDHEDWLKIGYEKRDRPERRKNPG